LLLTINFAPFIEFLLPLWVFVVSLHILRASLSRQPQPQSAPMPTTKANV